MRNVAIVVENFKCTGIVWFCNSKVTTFPTSTKCKNFNFSLYNVPAEMPYLQKYFNEFSKTFYLAERRVRWLLWLKISSAQTFSFFSSNVTTFPTSRKCKNYNFSLYNVPAEMLYLQKYLYEFSKPFFCLKDNEGGYCGWKFQVQRHFALGIATFPFFQHPENVKIPIFPFRLSHQKCWYLQKYFNELSKTFHSPETWGRWLLWLKISCVQTFYFFSNNVATFPTSRKCKNLNFSLHTVPEEMLYLQKYLKNFQKKSFCLKDDEGGYCGWKFQEHRHFAFAIATLPLFQHPENVIISIFPFTLSQQKCYILKNI